MGASFPPPWYIYICMPFFYLHILKSPFLSKTCLVGYSRRYLSPLEKTYANKIYTLILVTEVKYPNFGKVIIKIV